MKQFITILLISLCLTQLTFGRISKECVDDDTVCKWSDFSKTNHSVDDDSAIVCDAAAVMGQIGDNGPNKCYGIFDGCFGKGEDEKNQVTCTAVTEKCEVNPDAVSGDCSVDCDTEDPCGTAKDSAASPAPCCVGYSKAQMEAACTAWQDSLHCAPSILKILLLWIAPILIVVGALLAPSLMGKKSNIQDSTGANNGYNKLVRGRRGRVNF